MARKRRVKRSPGECHIVVTKVRQGLHLVGVGVRKKYGRRVYRDAFFSRGTRVKAKKLGEKIARQQGCRRGTGVTQ